jgi:hypothetical protein
MTLNQYADYIVGDIYKEPLTHTLRERVKFAIKFLAAVFIRRDAERNPISDQYLLTYNFKLKKVDQLDTCAAALGCSVLRSVNKIPKPVRMNTDSDFVFVGSLDSKVWARVRFHELLYTKANKYNSKEIRYDYLQGYIYVFNNLKFEYGKIIAAFENPSQAISFCDNACADDDAEYPLPADIFDMIIARLLELGAGRLEEKDLEINTDDKVRSDARTRDSIIS